MREARIGEVVVYREDGKDYPAIVTRGSYNYRTRDTLIRNVVGLVALVHNGTTLEWRPRMDVEAEGPDADGERCWRHDVGMDPQAMRDAQQRANDYNRDVERAQRPAQALRPQQPELRALQALEAMAEPTVDRVVTRCIALAREWGCPIDTDGTGEWLPPYLYMTRLARVALRGRWRDDLLP